MKHCPACAIDQPDTASFCKYCGGELVVRNVDTRGGQQCPSCGADVRSDWRFCKRCAREIQSVTSEVSQPAVTLPVSQPAALTNPLVTAGATDKSSETRDGFPVRESSSAGRRNLVIAALVLAVLLGGAVVVYLLMSGSAESKLEKAISKGNLVNPPGESAWDFYQQLKREGAGADKLARFNEKLLPMLVSRPQQMLADFAQIGSKDPDVVEWEQASKLMAWASEIKPGDGPLAARANYCAGRVAYLKNNKEEALRLWRRGSELDTSWAMPPNGVGLIYNERKEYSAARQYLLEAIRREPNWALPYNNIGTSLFYEKNDERARYYYQQAVRYAPRWARPHVWLGDIAMRAKDYHLAMQEYQAALDLAEPGISLDLEKIRQQLERARQLSEQHPASQPIPSQSSVPNNMSESSSATVTKISCTDEANIRSTGSVGETSYTITNRTNGTLIVYWLDYDGKRRKWFEVPAGQTHNQGTFKTHPWLVTDSKGKCLRIFNAPAKIIIE